jgi:glycogen(starch) synthase
MHYLLTTGVAGQFWASRLEIPTVTTLIGMDVYDPLYRPAGILRFLMRWAIRQSDAVTCISTFVRDVVARDFPPAPSVGLTVVPYGVDTKQFRPDVSGFEVRQRYAVRPYEKLVLTVQRLYARKGVQQFIQAAPLVLQKCPDTKFLVVGDGPERKSLEVLVKDLTIADKIIFAGEVNNDSLPSFYTASDVFAFHTFHEGLGIVLLEAISSGRSVVTTSAGGTVDIIRHGENGLIVPAGDHWLLADAIVRLLCDEQLRNSMASRGRRLAETEFDWDRVAERYLEVFEQVQYRAVRAC